MEKITLEEEAKSYVLLPEEIEKYRGKYVFVSDSDPKRVAHSGDNTIEVMEKSRKERAGHGFWIYPVRVKKEEEV